MKQNRTEDPQRTVVNPREPNIDIVGSETETEVYSKRGDTDTEVCHRRDTDTGLKGEYPFLWSVT